MPVMPIGATPMRARAVLWLCLLAAVPPGVAAAQDFYQGREISLQVGSGPGGAYDTFGRLLARHLGRHIQGNPSIVVVNVPGASGRRMIDFVYNVAPKDGTVIGTGLSTLAFDPLMGTDARFDAQKIEWIGSSNKETAACIMWHGSPIRSIDDVRQRTTAVGSSGPSSTDSIYPNVMNALFGMKFTVINGYTSAPQMNMAIEGGELDGRCGLTLSSLRSVNAEWVKNGKIRIILQFALERHPDLKDVPFVFDLARTEEERQILTVWAAPNQMGRPYFTSPGVPRDRLLVLRRAFDATMKDPAYLADAARIGVGADAMTGEAVEALVRRVYATPKAVVEKAGIAANQRR
jgi:tripartite-type tricarboxylate transporter receptor subunit TctC